MAHLRTTLVAAACGAAALCTASSAFALGPIGIEAGAKVGYATNPDSGGGTNPLGFGLGGRAGITFASIYAGASVMYYLGGSTGSGNDNGVSTPSVSFNSLLYGGELGYGFNILLLTIRPQVGLGNASFMSNAAGSSTKSNLYVEPGVTGLVNLGLLYVGADANVLTFPGLDGAQAAFSFHGQVGVEF